VESSCEFGIEPSGSIKCWEAKLSSVQTTRDLSSSVQLHRVSYLIIGVDGEEVYSVSRDGRGEGLD
jgi:hypothetical protein